MTVLLLAFAALFCRDGTHGGVIGFVLVIVKGLVLVDAEMAELDRAIFTVDTWLGGWVVLDRFMGRSSFCHDIRDGRQRTAWWGLPHHMLHSPRDGKARVYGPVGGQVASSAAGASMIVHVRQG